MEGGSATFRKDVPFHMLIQGAVNGKSFSVEGKGFGNSATGRLKGKWICTSGKLPIAWAALAGTLGFGFKCFAHFPNGMTHFFQECMPDGYTQERINRFQEGGTIKSYHEVNFQKGVILNKVTLQGESFKEDSPVINNGIKSFLPSTETTFPFEEGVKSLVYHLYPLQDDSGRYLVATQTTVNRPLAEGKVVKQPGHHFTRTEVRQTKDIDDDSDHIIQEEVVEGYDLKLLT